MYRVRMVRSYPLTVRAFHFISFHSFVLGSVMYFDRTRSGDDILFKLGISSQIQFLSTRI